MFFRVKFIEGLPPCISGPDAPGRFQRSNFDTLVLKVCDRMSAQKEGSGKFRAATASVEKQWLTCPRCTGPHRERDCTQRRCFKAPRPDKYSSNGQSSVCFCCKRPEHFGWRGLQTSRSVNLAVIRKDSVVWGNPPSPGDLVVIGASAPVTSTLGVLVTAGRFSSREMPVVTVLLGCLSFHQPPGLSLSCLSSSDLG